VLSSSLLLCRCCCCCPVVVVVVNAAAIDQNLMEMLPSLLVLLSAHSGLSTLQSSSRRIQSHQVAHLFLRAIYRLVTTRREMLVLTDEMSSPPSPSSTHVQIALSSMRHMLHHNNQAASTLYDLLLDVLLYQPVSGSIPPDGLSQCGHERLRDGPSTVSNIISSMSTSHQNK
jgi:hypothetical protein